MQDRSHSSTGETDHAGEVMQNAGSSHQDDAGRRRSMPEHRARGSSARSPQRPSWCTGVVATPAVPGDIDGRVHRAPVAVQASITSRRASTLDDQFALSEISLTPSCGSKLELPDAERLSGRLARSRRGRAERHRRRRRRSCRRLGGGGPPAPAVRDHRGGRHRPGQVQRDPRSAVVLGATGTGRLGRLIQFTVDVVKAPDLDSDPDRRRRARSDRSEVARASASSITAGNTFGQATQRRRHRRDHGPAVDARASRTAVSSASSRWVGVHRYRDRVRPSRQPDADGHGDLRRLRPGRRGLAPAPRSPCH